MRRISVGLGWQNRASIEDFVEQAHVADDSGVSLITTGENWRREAFAPLAVLARETKQAQLGTSIVNIWSRSAAALAEHFGTLDELSGGRMVIGLGTSSANVSEHFSGIPYHRPMRRMREYIEIINMLISGAPLQYGAPTHQEFLNHWTPQAYRSPRVPLSSIAGWALFPLVKRADKSKCEQEIAEYRALVMQGVPAAAPRCTQ